MKRIFISAILLFLFTNITYSQYVKIDNSLALSSFHNKSNLDILSQNKLQTYSFSIGLDYLENKWFSLSSQIGYISLGGKEINPALQNENYSVSESKNYVHINTTFRLLKKYSNTKLILGVGPFINLIADSKGFNSNLYKPYYSSKSLFVGGKGELGVTEDIRRFRLGILGSYLYSLTPVASSDYLNLKNNPIVISITAGYKL